jgi:hypothetical protein
MVALRIAKDVTVGACDDFMEVAEVEVGCTNRERYREQ